MRIEQRNNIRINEAVSPADGANTATIVFAHGFGCDQTMWRYLEPMFRDRYRTVLFDLVGCGNSDLSAYDFDSYTSLHAHAGDLLQVIKAVGDGPVICIGHSVSSMTALLASIAEPQRFAAQIMLAPSPCYIDDPDSNYHGGFSRADIDDLLGAMDSNYLGWAGTMAPAIMGAPEQPALGQELAHSFCRTDPTIALHFARTTFLSDHRADLPRNTTPALIVQCDDDFIAPMPVGDYLRAHLPHSTLQVIENMGHCPHMSAPQACHAPIRAFLDGLHL
ncbi:alpha/beta fold hydrolase [Janthinobacterium sp. PC23-8]|uniref:alpha/beta fold hydrolase n=1 Tax=Janthinobacterium sp. PC23-8 TaxID=2012679 RepID=UPI000B97AFBA|nr:alpha/beta hydrolase [Janthinobacterium sp. PC23-8]OYO28626.1 alpha/beta hydrolase [Janthinobacterium sp. PC23-8]